MKTKENRIQKKINKKSNVIFKKTNLILTLLILVLVFAFCQNKTKQIDLSAVEKKINAYEPTRTRDSQISGVDGITFDSYVINSKSDGTTESVRGTVNAVGEEDKLYMELNVAEGVTLQDAKIQINAKNFYLNTTISADNVVANTYAETNTTEIALNDIDFSVNKIINATIRSGEYGRNKDKALALGNNTNNYSREDNTITLSGTYISSTGQSKDFTKTVKLTVDWYANKPTADIKATGTLTEVDKMESLVEDGKVKLKFNVTARETANQGLIKQNITTVQIPKLNSIDPISVKFDDADVQSDGLNYTYDINTDTYTLTRTAKVNSNGQIEKQAFDIQTSNNYRETIYPVTVEYPIEVLDSQTTPLGLSVPITSKYTCFNNKDFENPIESNEAIRAVAYTWAEDESSENADLQAAAVSLGINVGTSTSAGYYVSKENAYVKLNGQEPLETDTYQLYWSAYTGTENMSSGLVFQDSYTDSGVDYREYFNYNGTKISTQGFTKYTGIAFNGSPTSYIGSSGQIRIYDGSKYVEGGKNTPVQTISASTGNSYANNTRFLSLSVQLDRIVIETTAVNQNVTFGIYLQKQIDFDALIEKYSTVTEMDKLTDIYSSLKLTFQHSDNAELADEIRMSKNSGTNFQIPTNYLVLSTTDTTFNTTQRYTETISITARKNDISEQYWQDSKFLLRLPPKFIDVEIESITATNGILINSWSQTRGSDNSTLITIIPDNPDPSFFKIEVIAKLTPDPTLNTVTDTIRVYAQNSLTHEQRIFKDYRQADTDYYNLTGNTSARVGYLSNTVTFKADSSLILTQQGVGGTGDYSGVTYMAPDVVPVDSTNLQTTYNIIATNNTGSTVSGITITGVLPYAGNKSPVDGTTDLGSSSTQNISSEFTGSSGTSATYTTDFNTYSAWGDIADKTTIKGFKITYSGTVANGGTLTFTSGLTGLSSSAFNAVGYSMVKADYTAGSNAGTSASAKLGFAKTKYSTLTVTNAQSGYTTKKLSGSTFVLTDMSDSTSTIVTSAVTTGQAVFTNLKKDQLYKLEQTLVGSDYVKIDDSTYFKIRDSGVAFRTEADGSASTPSYISDVTGTSEVSLTFLNNVKPRVQVIAYSGDTETVIQNASYTITGYGKPDQGQLSSTDGTGVTNFAGLYLNQEYTITTTMVKGHYVDTTAYTFTITPNGGTFAHNLGASTYLRSATINISDGIPTLEICINNDPVPSFSLELTKLGSDDNATKPGAQFKLFGPDISTAGTLLTTNASGVLTIDGLNCLVTDNDTFTGTPRGGATQTYTLKEVYAPQGYVIDNRPIQFQVLKYSTPVDGNYYALNIISNTNTHVTQCELTNPYALTASLSSVEEEDEEELVSLSSYEEGEEYYPEVQEHQVGDLEDQMDLENLYSNYLNEDMSSFVLYSTDEFEEQSGSNEYENSCLTIRMTNDPNFKLTKYGYRTSEASDASTQETLANTKFLLKKIENYKEVPALDEYGQGLGANLSPIGTIRTTLTFTKDPNADYGFTYDSVNGVYTSANTGRASTVSGALSQQFSVAAGQELNFQIKSDGETSYDYAYYKILKSGDGGVWTTVKETDNIYGKQLNTDKMYITQSYIFPEAGNYQIGIYYVKDSKTDVGNDTGYFKDFNITSDVTYSGIETNSEGYAIVKIPEGEYVISEMYEASPAYRIDQTKYNFQTLGSAAEVRTYTATSNSYIDSDGWNSFNDLLKASDGSLYAVGKISYETPAKFGRSTSTSSTHIDKTQSGKAQSTDAVIVKYNSDGDYIWHTSFASERFDGFNKVIELSDGNFIAAGYLSSTHEDGYIVKFDSSGRTIATQTFTGDTTKEADADKRNFTEKINDIVELDDGSIIAVGYTESPYFKAGTFSLKNSGFMDGFIVKMDASLNVENVLLLGGEQDDNVMAVNKTSNGFIVLYDYFVGQVVQGVPILGKSDSNTTAIISFDKDFNVSHAYTVRPDDNDVTKHSIGAGIEYGSIGIYAYGSTSCTCKLYDGTTAIRDIPIGNYIIRLSHDGSYAEGDQSSNKTISFFGIDSVVNDVIERETDSGETQILACGTQYDAVTVNGFALTNDTTGGNGYVITFDDKLREVSAFNTIGGPETSYDDAFAVEYNSTTNQLYVAGQSDGRQITTKTADETKSFILNQSTMLYTNAYLINFDTEIQEADAPTMETLDVNNYKKQFTITTEMTTFKNNTQEGGTITGQYGTFNDIVYDSSKYIQYVEQVVYGENSTQAITITPDASKGYLIDTVKINGQTYAGTINGDGSMTIPVFTNVTENKHIEVSFKKGISHVYTYHKEFKNGATTNTELATKETQSGQIDTDSYTTSPNATVLEDYNLVKNSDMYTADQLTSLGLSGSASYTPQNASGTYAVADTEVTYYYVRKQFTVTTNHLIYGTSNPVPAKAGGTVAPVVSALIDKGQSYTTTATNLIDDQVYELVATPDNATGTVLANTTVNYYYRLKDSAGVVVHHYLVGTTDKVPSNKTYTNANEGATTVQDVHLPTSGTAKVTDPYTTTDAVTNIQSNYELAKNKDVYTSAELTTLGLNGESDYTPANASGNYVLNTTEVIYYYREKAPVINNLSLTKSADISTLTSLSNTVNYSFTYNHTVVDYKTASANIGNEKVVIVDQLPGSIDLANSNLNGGSYNSTNKTITWEFTLPAIDTPSDASSGNYTVTRNFSIRYSDLTNYATNVVNTISGYAQLANARSDTAYGTNTITPDLKETYTFNTTWADNSNSHNVRPSSTTLSIKGYTLTSCTDSTSTYYYGTSVLTHGEATSVELTSGNSYTGTIANLPQYVVNDGTAYHITYDFALTMADEARRVYTTNIAVDANNEFTYNITNTYTTNTSKVSVVANTVWANESGKDLTKKPSSTLIDLYKVDASGNKVGNALSTYEMNVASSTYTFANLDKYTDKGEVILYKAFEREKTTGDLKFYSINTEKTSSTDDQIYSDFATQLRAYATAQSLGTLSDSDISKWYSYETVVTQSANDELLLAKAIEIKTNLTSQTQWTITNTYTVPNEVKSVEINSTWSDNSNQYSHRPSSVKVNIYKQSNGSAKVLAQENTLSNCLTGNTQTNSNASTLPKYDENGYDITYTMEQVETSQDGLLYYQTSYTLDTSNASKWIFNVTNTYVVPSTTVDINVTKVWVDNEVQARRRPATININLVNNTTKEIVETHAISKNDGSTSFTGIPVYDNSGEISYTVTETEVSSGDLYFYNNAVTGNKTSGFTVTNTFVRPTDTQNIGVAQVWDIDNANTEMLSEIPANVTLTLTDSTNASYSKSLTLTSANAEAENDKRWTGTINSLDVYNANGEDIVYNLTNSFGNSGLFVTQVNGSNRFEIISTPVITATTLNVTQPAKMSALDQVIETNITYTANMTGLTGSAGYVVTYTLPYEIDTSASNDLQGGSYNSATKTITWNLSSSENINFNKNLRFVLQDVPLDEASIDTTTKANITIGGASHEMTKQASTEVDFSKYVVINKHWTGDKTQIGENEYIISSAKPANVTIEILGSVNGETPTHVQDVVITGANNADDWQSQTIQLPKYDANKDEITYTVRETNIVSAYYNNIEYNGDTINVENLRYGSIKVTNIVKNDPEKKIGGTTFMLEKLDEHGEVDESFTPVELITEEDDELATYGTATFERLKYGTYRLSETMPSSDDTYNEFGYTHNTKTYTLTIDEDNVELEQTFESRYSLGLPETGSLALNTIGITAIVLIIAISVNKYRKARLRSRRSRSK